MINKTEINTHLEYLGYTTEVDNGDHIFAIKLGYPAIEIRQNENHIAVRSAYDKNNNAVNDQLGFFDYVNTLNLCSGSTVFIDLKLSLAMFIRIYGPYQRSEFAKMMNEWESDVTEFLDSRKRTPLYLSPDCPEIDKELLSIPENDRIVA